MDQKWKTKKAVGRDRPPVDVLRSHVQALQARCEEAWGTIGAYLEEVKDAKRDVDLEPFQKSSLGSVIRLASNAEKTLFKASSFPVLEDLEAHPDYRLE